MADAFSDAPKTSRKSSGKKPAGETLAAAGVVDQQTAASAPRSAISEQLSATRDTIRTEAQRKAAELGDEFNRLTSQATGRAKEAAVAGKGRAAEGLETLAKLISDSSAQVDDKLGTQYGDFARSAAQSVQGFAGSINQKDLDELMVEARDFVKKSPAVAIGSAAVVGFLLARLLRSKN